MNLPKILFLDTNLHKKEATAITLSNLFKYWPKDNLLFISEDAQIELSKADGYDNFFRLTKKEKKHVFPLNLLKLSSNSPTEDNQSYNQKANKTNNKINIVEILTYIFKKLGLNYFFFRIRITIDLINWIKETNPEYFYCVLSTRHSILFAIEIQKLFNKPLIIHIMDDWPKTIGRETYFPNYWNKRINSELIKLMQVSYKNIAISDEMAREYQNRFGGNWTYFHNLVDKSKWFGFNLNLKKNDVKSKIKIGYFGRIGKANDETILQFIDIVKNNDNKTTEIEFHIFTDFIKSSINIENSKNVFFHEFITAEELPEKISNFDFLLLPLSFNEEDLNFSKFSFPTKFSEYLISGVPILLIAPETSAVYKFGEKNDCAFLINKCDKTLIELVLNVAINNKILYHKIAENGKKIAEKELDYDTMGKKFIEIFTK